MNLNEITLVRRAAHGDAQAFHTLVDMHARHLYAVACQWVKPGADAEDLVQETLLAALQGLKYFEGRASFRTWLVVILTRQAALWHRRGKIRQTVELSGNELADMAGGQTQTEARIDLSAMMRKINPEYRQVLVLRELEGLSYDEIAEALKVPRGTVESRLHRAREQLRAVAKGEPS